MSIEEIKKLVSEHPLDEKDFEPYAVQMKIRIGLVTRNKVHDRRLLQRTQLQHLSVLEA